MWMNRVVGEVIDRIVDRVQRTTRRQAQDQGNTDLVAHWAASSNDLKDMSYPGFHLDFIRQWIEDAQIDVRDLKPISGSMDSSAIRYCTLLDTLRSRVPVESLSVARTVAVAADRLLARRDPIEFETWHADIGMHFFISSSLARKGRLLQAVVRFMRPHRYLELGTAYGMSALFVGLAWETIHDSCFITTVELSALQHQIATELLGDHFGDRTECHLATSQAALLLLTACLLYTSRCV